jgi:hypothetical protein
MHIGIVTSSLGGRGSSTCPTSGTASKNPANPTLDAHNDDRGHLIDRAGDDEHAVTDAAPSNFLAWFPSVPENAGQPKPPVAALGDPRQLLGDMQGLVGGVHEHGCNFEAQNEAWYRFLVQPDPFDSVTVDSTLGSERAKLNGTDAVLLQQRAAFLRPDSLVAVVVVTDENEEVADPLAINGQAWAFEEQMGFPGSPTGAAPQGTIECARQDPDSPATTGPNDPNCTSCGFLQNDPNALAARCPQDGANGKMGYLDPNDDALNLRFFQQKRRFGVFAGYPVSRYVRGLTSASVPDRTTEHDDAGNYIGDQDANAGCVNPLFAASLPTDPSADLCHLARGGRGPSFIHFVVIGGVPHQLLQVNPTDPNSPQKEALSTADWKKILGNDPEHYDFRGIDFHMVESTEPRVDPSAQGWATASNCPPTSADTCDAMSGREWTTNKSDLQFACVFDLAQPKDCSQMKYADACDCALNALDATSHLCQRTSSGDFTQTQIRGKAYPSIRELMISKALGAQASVSSICPIHTQPTTADDPLYGYRPAVDALVDRLAPQIPK